MKKWIGWVIVVGAIVFLGVWASGRLLSTVRANESVQVNVTATPLISKLDQSLEAKLMDPNVDLAARESLMEKIEIQKRADDNEKAGLTNPASKEGAASPAPAAMLASSQVETGIFEGSEGMIRPDQAQIQNYWRGVVEGKIFMVMAGSTAVDKDQGLIVLVIASLDPTDSTISFDFINSTTKSGSLRVVDMKGSRVILQSAGGLKFQFDIKTRIFVQ